MFDEPRIPFAAVPGLLGPVGRGGALVSVETVKGWARKGRLRAEKIGAKWVTTKTWLEEFIAVGSPTAATEVRSPSTRRREVDAAMKQLEALGA
jgi:hypothetical protein